MVGIRSFPFGAKGLFSGVMLVSGSMRQLIWFLNHFKVDVLHGVKHVGHLEFRWFALKSAFERNPISQQLYIYTNPIKTLSIGVSKNRGVSPKMDGLWWNTLLKWMIWGKTHYFLETPQCWVPIIANLIVSLTFYCWEPIELMLSHSSSSCWATESNMFFLVDGNQKSG